jgi:hypothetical protein
MTADERDPVALYITTGPDRLSVSPHDYYHATAAPVTIAADGSPRNITVLFDLDYPQNLADLRIRCQNDRDNAARGSHAYGWTVEYHEPYTVDTRRAATMHRTLAGIERALARLDAKYGPPSTFGAYVLRVADALRIDRFIVPVRQADRYPDGEYRYPDAAAAAYHLDAQDREWIRVCQPDYQPEPAP